MTIKKTAEPLAQSSLLQQSIHEENV